MREKLLSIGDDFWIEDSQGNAPTRSMARRSGSGTRSFSRTPPETRWRASRRRKLSVRDKVGDRARRRHRRDGPQGAGRAPGPLPIDVKGGADMKAHGNIVDHEYEIERDGHTVATISKKWFRVRESYGVEIAGGEDVPLLLAITVAIDSLT